MPSCPVGFRTSLDGMASHRLSGWLRHAGRGGAGRVPAARRAAAALPMSRPSPSGSGIGASRRAVWRSRPAGATPRHAVPGKAGVAISASARRVPNHLLEALRPGQDLPAPCPADRTPATAGARPDRPGEAAARSSCPPAEASGGPGHLPAGFRSRLRHCVALRVECE